MGKKVKNSCWLNGDCIANQQLPLQPPSIVNFDLKMGFASSRVWTWSTSISTLCWWCYWTIHHMCHGSLFKPSTRGFLPWLAGWLAWLPASQQYAGEARGFSHLLRWQLHCGFFTFFFLRAMSEPGENWWISTHGIIVYFLEHLGWVGAAARQAQKDLLQSALAHAVVFKAQITLLPLQGRKNVRKGDWFLWQTVLHPHHVLFLKNGTRELGLHEPVEERDGCQGCTLQLHSVTWRIEEKQNKKPTSMFHCYKNHLYFEALINTTESTKLGILLFSPTMSQVPCPYPWAHNLVLEPNHY